MEWLAWSLLSGLLFGLFLDMYRSSMPMLLRKVSVDVDRESSESVANDSSLLRVESSGTPAKWRLLVPLSIRRRRRTGVDWLIRNEQPSVTTFPNEHFFLSILFTIFFFRQITLYNFGKKIGKSTTEAASGWLNLTALPRIKFCSSMVQTTDKMMRCNVAAE